MLSYGMWSGREFRSVCPVLVILVSKPGDRLTCRAGEEPSTCPGSDPQEPSRGCKKCAFPVPNSAYIPPRDGLHCLWKCNPGFFASGEATGALAKMNEIDPSYFNDGVTANECRACTIRNETNCPGGMLPVECTGNQDFTCSQPCASGTKPLLNSRWLGNTIGLTACQWECVDTYEAIPTPSGLWFCRRM
jgi:hypothetical protein